VRERGERARPLGVVLRAAEGAGEAAERLLHPPAREEGLALEEARLARLRRLGVAREEERGAVDRVLRPPARERGARLPGERARLRLLPRPRDRVRLGLAPLDDRRREVGRGADERERRRDRRERAVALDRAREALERPERARLDRLLPQRAVEVVGERLPR